MSGISVAVVGATGAVGREMWRLLERASFPISEIHAFTSPRSAGTRLPFRGREVRCRSLAAEGPVPVDLVLASAGGAVSREWLPRFADLGAMVVDNSSAFRGDPRCPLVVPEINGDTLEPGASIIANPNCSTIQLVMALAPLHREWGLRAIRVATYQSASGAGNRLMEELRAGSRPFVDTDAVPGPSTELAFNVIPQIGAFDAAGETLEEVKMRNETRRILDEPDLAVSATCVRVPVFRGHSEAVWAGFHRDPDPDRARAILGKTPGVVVEDDPARGVYPVPRSAAGRDAVFVGRLRRDGVDPRGLGLWVVSDNLLKGAATNACQIAEALVARGLCPARGRG
jgi:aspartate-semialdehyde dehydrogenase